MSVDSIDIGFHAPFIGNVTNVELPEGNSISDMALQLFGSLDNLEAFMPSKDPYGDPHQIPKRNWHRVYPKKGSGFYFFVLPAGGNKTKQVLAVVAAIAVTVAAGPLAGAIVGDITSLTFLATQAALTAAGLYGVSLLFPAPTTSFRNNDDSGSGSFESVSAGSNLIQPGSSIPYVAGLRRIAPPQAAEPWLLLSETGQQLIRATYVLGGYHYLSEARADDNLIENMDNVIYEELDGNPNNSTSTFIKKVTKIKSVGVQSRKFQHDGSGSDPQIEDQDNPQNSEPQWIRMSSRGGNGLEEFYIRIKFSSLISTTSTTIDVVYPMRIRIRLIGSSTWINMPEIHWKGRFSNEFVREVRFRWDTDFGQVQESETISFNFFRRVPYGWDSFVGAPYLESNGNWNADQWNAHSSFTDTPTYETAQNISGCRRGVNIFLDPDDFEMGAYEIEIRFGYQIENTNWDPSIYEFSSFDRPVYFYAVDTSTDGTRQGPWDIDINQTRFLGNATIEYLTTVYDYEPVTRPGIAVMALQTENQGFNNFSIIAGKYVNDYNEGLWQIVEFDMRSLTAGGTDWVDNTITGIQLDLFSDVNDGDWHIDWIEVANDYGVVAERWNFDSTVESWAGNNATLAAPGDELTVSPTAANPSIYLGSLSIDGSIYYKVRVRMYADTPTDWEGVCYYSTGGHTYSASYYASVSEPVWGSDAWDNSIITKNPATHYRDLCLSDLNSGRVSEEVLDDEEIIGFWNECNTRGYECNLIVSGQSVAEAKLQICAAGLGRDRKSDSYGVFWQQDHSATIPVQTFSYMNCSELKWSKGFSRIPYGATVKFVNETLDYIEDEFNLNNPVGGDTVEYLYFEYASVTNPDLVRLRATFELLQIALQNLTWSFNTGLAHIRAKRGDVIGIAAPFISDYVDSSFIKEAISPVAFRIIQELEVSSTETFFDVTNMFTESNIFEVGREYGIAIQTPSGLEARKIVNVVDDVVYVDAPFTDDEDDLVQCHVLIGLYSSEYIKCIVTGVTPNNGESANITAVEYSQELEDLLRA